MSESGSSPLRRVAAKAAVALVAVGLTLVLAEQALRLADFVYHPMSIKVGNVADARTLHIFDDEHFVYDPRLIWRPRTSFGVFNEQGYRGPVLERERERPPAALRVFTVGDSNTLGWPGPEGGNWPGMLGERLARIHGPVEMVNAGVWGYSSYQGLARLREVVEFRPDLVLISFGSNDAHLVWVSDADFARQGLLRPGALRVASRFRLGQLAAAAWDRASMKGTREPVHRVALDAYRENLRSMIRLVRESGAEPMLLTRPYVGPVIDPGSWKAFAHEYNLATAEVGRDEDAYVLDIYTLFREQMELFADESHFTREGHQLAADQIARHLRPWLRTRAEAGSPTGAASVIP